MDNSKKAEKDNKTISFIRDERRAGYLADDLAHITKIWAGYRLLTDYWKDQVIQSERPG
ncbi:hypothetical protein [uncultured Amphritea sp.]|uniref:hypothetical protein n=1 Tax=uncultured Amphritea sp. TaxID=981605 RepID=UPI0026106467|nr:hypothetical protein [uncultured Amphritea sp.]